jgi:hypothetical protein
LPTRAGRCSAVGRAPAKAAIRRRGPGSGSGSGCSTSSANVIKECPAAVPDISLSGTRVVRDSQTLIVRRGRPGAIVCDKVPSSPFGGPGLCARRQASTGATSPARPTPERLRRSFRPDGMNASNERLFFWINHAPCSHPKPGDDYNTAQPDSGSKAASVKKPAKVPQSLRLASRCQPLHSSSRRCDLSPWRSRCAMPA